jgi:hypothetical protein
MIQINANSNELALKQANLNPEITQNFISGCLSMQALNLLAQTTQYIRRSNALL